MKIGILGGTFDPPHVGHVEMARAAIEELQLDEVIWVPANKNPLKRRRTTDAKVRLRMCRLATADEARMAVSDVETSRKGPSYAVETVTELKQVMPGEYWFLIGMDALVNVPDWMESERLLRLTQFAVFPRVGTDTETALDRAGRAVKERTQVMKSPVRTVSSSNIRDMAVRGEDFSHLVPAKVYGYIKENGLYTG